MRKRVGVGECLVRGGSANLQGFLFQRAGLFFLFRAVPLPIIASAIAPLKHGSTLGRMFASWILRFHLRSNLLEPCNPFFSERVRIISLLPTVNKCSPFAS